MKKLFSAFWLCILFCLTTLYGCNNRIYVSEEASLQRAFREGGDVWLEKDIVCSSPVTVSRDVTLHLNGKQLTCETTALLVTAGRLTVEGDGSVLGGKSASGNTVAVCGETASVFLKGGSFACGGDEKTANRCIFVQTGNVFIYGGTFRAAAEAENAFCVLDVEDNGPGTIVVYGGTFFGQDPSLGDDHSKGTFVAEGFFVQQEGNAFSVTRP